MIFVDTGPFLARCIESDQHHAAAADEWNRVEASAARLCTSHHVIDEFVTLLGRRAEPGFAAERARAILDSPRFSIYRSDEADERRALEIYEKFGDAGISHTDALSFSLMKRHRIQRAFTFDNHFRIFGFETVPYLSQ